MRALLQSTAEDLIAVDLDDDLGVPAHVREVVRKWLLIIVGPGGIVEVQVALEVTADDFPQLVCSDANTGYQDDHALAFAESTSRGCLELGAELPAAAIAPLEASLHRDVPGTGSITSQIDRCVCRRGSGRAGDENQRKGIKKVLGHGLLLISVFSTDTERFRRWEKI
jgi:hypothetical protein